MSPFVSPFFCLPFFTFSFSVYLSLVLFFLPSFLSFFLLSFVPLFLSLLIFFFLLGFCFIKEQHQNILLQFFFPFSYFGFLSCFLFQIPFSYLCCFLFYVVFLVQHECFEVLKRQVKNSNAWSRGGCDKTFFYKPVFCTPWKFPFFGPLFGKLWGNS